MTILILQVPLDYIKLLDSDLATDVVVSGSNGMQYRAHSVFNQYNYIRNMII